MMKTIVVILLFSLSIAEQKSYAGYKLLSVTPKNERQLNGLVSIQKKWDGPKTGVSFWSESFRINSPVLIQLSPDSFKIFVVELFKAVDIVKVTIQDIQELIDKQSAEREDKKRSQKDNGFLLDIYHPLEEIDEYLQTLAEQYEANFGTKYFEVGQSIEGRSINEFVIGGSDDKPAVMIDCTIHAREWVSATTCINIITDLLTDTDDPVTADLREQYSWYFIPVLNVDGYDFTWVTDRLWRKNRRIGELCDGVDLNRNYDANWGGEGSSDYQCSCDYRGAEPFSEPETQTVRRVLEDIGPRLKAFWTLHNFGQMYLLPYCYKFDLPQNYDAMLKVADIAVEAIEKTHGKDYNHGKCAEVLYVASGMASDYVYKTYGTNHSVTIEMRDKGEHGFLLPEDQIIPTYEENWNGIKAALAAMATKNN